MNVLKNDHQAGKIWSSKYNVYGTKNLAFGVNIFHSKNLPCYFKFLNNYPMCFT